ncbi:MAG: hypothetical protein Q9227_006887 [Pyrenula ochraceoflavens]
MFFIYACPLGLILLLVLRYTLQKWSAYAARKAAVRQHGCQDAPQYPHRDPVGYDLQQERLKSMAEGEGQKLWQRHFATYGKTFEEKFAGQKTITTMEPANYQYVLGTGAKDFYREEPPTKKRWVKTFIGPGILTSTGAEWKQHRSLITPIFQRAELVDVSIIEKHVDRLIEILPRDGSTFEAQEILRSMFLDSSSEFLLGEPLGCLDSEPSSKTTEFLETWHGAIAGLTKWRKAPRFNYIRYLFPNDFDSNCKKLHRIIDRYVQRALQETCQRPDQANEKKPAQTQQPGERPERYVFLNEAAKEIRDPVRLRNEVQNVFFVAQSNVAVMFAGALFHLARNPEIWSELRQVALTLGNQPLTFDLLRSLKPFRYVYNETFRVQGPGIFSERTAVNHSTLPTGGGPDGKAPIFVEKGTRVHCNNWSMHHDPAIWGSDAETFRPSRWGELEKPTQWEFVPFGGGPRICPALQQVLTNFLYVLVRLAKEYERIENRDPVMEYVTEWTNTLESRNGVKIALIPPGHGKA